MAEQPPRSDAARLFDEQRYLFARAMIPDPMLTVAYVYALKLAKSGLMHTDDPQVPGTPSSYGDPLMESILDVLTPNLEAALGMKLFQTYAYFRIYKTGDVLKRHTDRPACEISVTACLGGDVDEPWPIFVENNGKAAEIRMNPGDALIYRGCECPHWRDAFPGREQVQLFLHYVDQNGPHAAHKFDEINLRESGIDPDGDHLGDLHLPNQ